MSEPATELTRERLATTTEKIRAHRCGCEICWQHRNVLLAAAARLLAMKPASDEEIRRTLQVPDDETLDGWQLTAWRAAERRLLPFADEPAREGNEP